MRRRHLSTYPSGMFRGSQFTAVAGIIALLSFAAVGAYFYLHLYSGTSVPLAARSLTKEQRREATKKLAVRIREAVLAYEAKHGTLPSTLQELVPTYLAEVPQPLTSTMPFEYTVHGRGFTVKWELHANAMYQREWIDQDGKFHMDV